MPLLIDVGSSMSRAEDHRIQANCHNVLYISINSRETQPVLRCKMKDRSILQSSPLMPDLVDDDIVDAVLYTDRNIGRLHEPVAPVDSKPEHIRSPIFQQLGMVHIQ